MNFNAEPFKPEAQQAGKTWARIVDDLLRLIPGTGYLGLAPLRAAASCSARSFNSLVYIDNLDLPIVEVLDHHTTKYHLIVANLRYHIELTVSSKNRHGMHDFHLLTSHVDSEKRHEEYTFVSSVTSTSLNIVIRPPEFNDEDLKDYQEPAIRERYERFKEQKPSASCPHPANCYSTLFKIIRQPLISQEPKEIMIGNPTLNININPDILTKLHFTREDDRGCFVPPHVYEDTEEATQTRRSMVRQLLEVAVLAQKVQEQTKQHLFPSNFQNAIPLLKNMMRCNVHATANSVGATMPPLSDAEYSHYVALGASEYFSDELIVERFQTQSQNDPSNTHYYMEALKHVAQTRNSEDLQIKVMELLSLGIVPLSDVNEAYAQFGIDTQSQNDLDEDLLIDSYNDAVKMNPTSKSKLSKSLKVIADTRKSEKLRQFLSMDSMDVNQAYTYLNSGSEADDETIKVSFDLKSAELGEDNDELAKVALLRVAEHRKSFPLFHHYESLSFGTLPEFPLESAYQLIGVDRSMDVQSIITTFEIRINDSPEQLISLRQALRTIGQHLDSNAISKYLETGSTDDAEPEVGKIWPVGLNNIGNTCYLNSLLQYYFTLTPIRQAVLTYKESPDKEDITDTEALKNKKVGGRLVPAWEVKRSQECKYHCTTTWMFCSF